MKGMSDPSWQGQPNRPRFIHRPLTEKQIADVRIYRARRLILTAYEHLAAVSNWHNLGLARVCVLDAAHLLDDVHGFTD
jgi:hypothetical protein